MFSATYTAIQGIIISTVESAVVNILLLVITDSTVITETTASAMQRLQSKLTNIAPKTLKQ